MKKLGITAASIAAGTIAAVGVILTSGISASAETAAPTTAPSIAGQMDPGPRAPHDHTVVTGDEAQKVIDAVKAKDSAVTIETVQKDPDGSYDALGTKDGQRICFDVSADLATVTEHVGPQGGQRGQGGPGSQDAVVTGDEAQKVIDAVKARDAAVTVDVVRKDPDGSYDALGTKDGDRVLYDVSSDLGTITENVRPAGGPHGPGAPDAAPSTTTVTG